MVVPPISPDGRDALKDQSVGSSSWCSRKLSRVLVVFELTLSSALLVVAALATKSLLDLRAVEPRFRVDQVFTRSPVLRVAAATPRADGHPPRDRRPIVRHLAVTPGFFKTFGVAVTRGRATLLTTPVRALVASLDRDLPVYEVASMTEFMRQSTWPSRVFGGLFAVFAIVALALASIRLYAVLALAVSQREREMGIRRSATLAATGFAACIVPALRATTADPLRTLRAE